MRDSSPPRHPAAQRLRGCDGFRHLPFRPVPVKPRHDGWTPARQRGFIDRLVVTGCVAVAARAVGKTPQSAYRLRDHAGAASFRRAWDEALDAGQAFVLDVAVARSLVGETVPIMRLGRVTGLVHRHDNRLIFATLKAMDRIAARGGEDPVLVLERELALLELAAQREAADKPSIEK